MKTKYDVMIADRTGETFFDIVGDLPRMGDEYQIDPIGTEAEPQHYMVKSVRHRTAMKQESSPLQIRIVPENPLVILVK